MKLTLRIACRLSMVMIPLLTLWATLFYVAMVGEINDEMDLADLSFVLTIANGKYESMALTVTYTTVLADQPTTVTTSMTATFTYDGVAPLTAPADADTYTEINIEDLLG